MAKLVIMEMLRIGTKKIFYSVVEDDGHKYPEIARFKTLEDAEQFIETREK